jgi:SPOR domain
MQKSIFVLVVILCCSALCHAQGKVHFNEPANVSTLFTNYVIKNRTETTIRGWRIQIVSTDDRREMENIKSKFSNLYPGIPSAWKHVSPYYHVRVGAYRTKTEMMSFLATLKKDFPAAIPVQDDIQKYDLISY